ncbi:DgyrCDS10331 [Dimorphilus gyrociliatus]|uniref:DgyrCDS10331 n=1 Tax=Dimorphilus gyrociliatus TaxID=2664684 RepID=A0A7I8W117_9ANNE|nr:DgyrCDS10331 [Dimorphilus gyrociliatus]
MSTFTCSRAKRRKFSTDKVITPYRRSKKRPTTGFSRGRPSSATVGGEEEIDSALNRISKRQQQRNYTYNLLDSFSSTDLQTESATELEAARAKHQAEVAAAHARVQQNVKVDEPKTFVPRAPSIPKMGAKRQATHRLISRYAAFRLHTRALVLPA